MRDSKKTIEILPIQNGWLVILPEKDLTDRVLEKYSSTMEKIMGPERSEIEQIIQGSKGPGFNLNDLIPEDPFFQDNFIYFAKLTDLTDYLIKQYAA